MFGVNNSIRSNFRRAAPSHGLLLYGERPQGPTRSHGRIQPGLHSEARADRDPGADSRRPAAVRAERARLRRAQRGHRGCLDAMQQQLPRAGGAPRLPETGGPLRLHGVQRRFSGGRLVPGGRALRIRGHRAVASRERIARAAYFTARARASSLRPERERAAVAGLGGRGQPERPVHGATGPQVLHARIGWLRSEVLGPSRVEGVTKL